MHRLAPATEAALMNAIICCDCRWLQNHLLYRLSRNSISTEEAATLLTPEGLEAYKQERRAFLLQTDSQRAALAQMSK